jgi:tripartite-type tricarboxylate transporter receptor subunit TctC
VKALDSTDMRARFFVQGMETVGNTPEEFARAMNTERARWATVVKERKISVK